jgi:hypothetical protein
MIILNKQKNQTQAIINHIEDNEERLYTGGSFSTLKELSFNRIKVLFMKS